MWSDLPKVVKTKKYGSLNVSTQYYETTSKLVAENP